MAISVINLLNLKFWCCDFCRVRPYFISLEHFPKLLEMRFSVSDSFIWRWASKEKLFFTSDATFKQIRIVQTSGSLLNKQKLDCLRCANPLLSAARSDSLSRRLEQLRLSHHASSLLSRIASSRLLSSALVSSRLSPLVNRLSHRLLSSPLVPPLSSHLVSRH